jgi:alpha-glucosidase
VVEFSGTDWWKHAVFYQIYPRSFQDTNGDGIGDLQGIIERLDYLNDGTERSLGVDAIWLSPTFPSPMKDFGYDVADYRDVHPDFGDLRTMDRLIAECHRRGIRVLLDFVPNHTSDQHAWFIESRSSRAAHRRHWYIWRDAKPDGYLPNNWISVFGGPAWTFDDHTGQYYLHSFLAEQPDLNWRNPEVERAMHDVLRFWLSRGVDGFRMDVVGMIIKDAELTDDLPNSDYRPGEPEYHRLHHENSVNYPDVYPAVQRIRTVLEEYPGAMAVGEVFGTAEEIGFYYGPPDSGGLHLAFNFRLILREGRFTPWEAREISFVLAETEGDLPPHAHPCYALGNHDQPRFISRHNADGRGPLRARAAALLLLGVRGTPFIYYGEEIGMQDVEIPEDRMQDPARFHHLCRDPERTPMQWDRSPGRGFTTGEPWLPFGPIEIDVASQLDDPNSLLALYRRAIRIRKQEPALHAGAMCVLPGGDDVVCFERTAEDARPVLCVINTSPHAVRVPLPEGYASVLLSTQLEGAARVCDGVLHLDDLAAAWLVP